MNACQLKNSVWSVRYASKLGIANGKELKALAHEIVSVVGAGNLPAVVAGKVDASIKFVGYIH